MNYQTNRTYYLLSDSINEEGFMPFAIYDEDHWELGIARPSKDLWNNHSAALNPIDFLNMKSWVSCYQKMGLGVLLTWVQDGSFERMSRTDFETKIKLTLGTTLFSSSQFKDLETKATNTH